MLQTPFIWPTSSVELPALVKRAEFWSNMGLGGPLKRAQKGKNL